MSNFSALKTAIQTAIKQNGNNEITGDILQDILLSIVSTLGDSAINNLETGLQTESQTRGNDDANLQQAINNEATTRGNADTALGNLITGIKNNIDNGYVYAGVATPSTTPVSGKVFYIATQAGTYTNLGNTAVKPGISILKYNGSAWSNEQVIYTDGGVFDVSAYNGGATYASLEALLSDANLSTIIPSAVRKGGMSIKFIQTSDNKYVQYRLTSNTFSTSVSNWQLQDMTFDGTYNNSNVNNILKNGLYKNTQYPLVFLQVNAVDSNHIIQGQYGVSSVSKDVSINTRETEDGGQTWSAWKPFTNINMFTKTFDYSQVNSIIEPGIYRSGQYNESYGSQILIVRTGANTITSAHNISQFLIASTYRGNGQTVYRISEDNGTTWSEWKGIYEELSDDFYGFSKSEISTKVIDYKNNIEKNTRYIINENNLWDFVNSGIYLVPIEKYSKLHITASQNGDTYYSFLTTNTITFSSIPDYARGYGSVVSIAANTTEDIDVPVDAKYLYLLCTINSVDILPTNISGEYFSARKQLKEEYGLTHRETLSISELTVVNAGIDVNGLWQPTSPGTMGKVLIIPIANNAIQIELFLPSNTSISFLRSLPISYSLNALVDFAYGETGRRNISVGNIALEIPGGTNYIAIGCETSSGGNIAPSSIRLVYNELVKEANDVGQYLISVHNQKLDGDTIHLENMSNVVPVSDPLSALASGEVNFYYESETGLVYFTCIEGFDHPYEAYDCVSLYVFSITNPNIVKRFQFGEKRNGKKCAAPNIVTLSYNDGTSIVNTKKVRVFYSLYNEDTTDGAYLYYRDFDFSTETFTNEAKVKLTDNSSLTAAKMLEYMTTNGGVNIGKDYIYLDGITDIASDGYRYASARCGESVDYNPIIVRSNDNFLTCEFVALTSFRVRYDCELGVIGNKLYFVFRVAGNEYAASSGTALCTAEISNGSITNWSNPVKFAEGDSRPDCYTYNNKIYMTAGNLHSVQNKPVRVSSSVWEGTSDDPADYTKVLIISDTRGVQNPRIFRYGCGDYGVLMGNSPSRVDYGRTWGPQWQFKTAICFVCSRIN